MTIILENVIKTLGTAYESGKFNVRDFIAVLQGLVGFGKAIKGGKPGDFIDAALGIAESLRGKSCLKSLSQYTDSVRKWLTFGEIYQPYEDSSQLDFDQLDVSSIPDIMKVGIRQGHPMREVWNGVALFFPYHQGCIEDTVVTSPY